MCCVIRYRFSLVALLYGLPHEQNQDQGSAKLSHKATQHRQYFKEIKISFTCVDI